MTTQIGYFDTVANTFRAVDSTHPFPVESVGATYLSKRATADLQIKAGSGFIHNVTIGALTATPVAGLLTIYDSLTETGTIIWAGWIFATQQPITIVLDAPVGTGIFVGFDATLASVNASVSYL